MDAVEFSKLVDHLVNGLTLATKDIESLLVAVVLLVVTAKKLAKLIPQKKVFA